ncbi:MAG: DUF4390 domain-containing protein [Burkholderiales bacterium]
MLSVVIGLGVPGGAANAQGEPEIAQMELERDADGLFLTATLQLELPGIVEDALEKGIPMFFVAEAALLRDRWYWTDKRVALSERYFRLAYLPLTRRWRVNVGSEPLSNPGVGVSLSQHYESMDEAVEAIERIARWKIADHSQMEPEVRYWVDFSFRLDLSQLPRPFQIGAVGQGEWNLTASRTLRLPPERTK